MKIKLQGKNLELTDSIKEHILKNISNLEKLLSSLEQSGAEAVVSFEVSKNTKHHKSGEMFHSDCHITVNGEKYYSGSDKEDLYQAIDEVRETLFREISKKRDREQTLFKRGALSIKKMLKGLSKRNPFTTRYEKTKNKEE